MLEKIPVTEKTLEKIFCYADRVCELSNKSLECYGYLTTPNRINNGVVYGACLPSNQLAERVKTKLNARDVIIAAKEIRSKGQRIIGCWQSHGHGEVCHSREDNENLETLLMSLALKNNYPVYESLVLYGDNISIRDKDGKTVLILPEYFGPTEKEKFRVELNNYDPSFFVELGDLDSEYRIGVKSKIIGYTYSIVVNSKRDMHAKLGILEICNGCGARKMNLKEVEIEKVKTNKDVEFTKEEIDEEIKRKVIVNSIWQKLFG